MSILSLFLGSTSKKINDFKARNAIILDVRTKAEFESGAISEAKNIPLDRIRNEINTLKKQNRPVITYCARGIRSANAASILRQHNIEALNGGGIDNMAKKLKL